MDNFKDVVSTDLFKSNFIQTLHNTLPLIQPNFKSKMSQSLTCNICYTEHPVEFNEDGSRKLLPISGDSTYFWTKQMHPGCSCPENQLHCRSCIAHHLTVRLDGNQSLTCIYCSNPIEHEMAMQLLPEDKRDQCEKKYWLGKGLKECYNTDCRANFVFERSDDCSNPITYCPDCHYPYCAQCGDQFHGALNCKTYVEALDIMQNKVRKNGFRYCPTCKTPIERISGCNHMQCTQCAQEWCYDCELPMNSGHSCTQESMLRVKRLERLTRLFERLDVSDERRGRGRGRGGRGHGRRRGGFRGGRGRGAAIVVEARAAPEQPQEQAPQEQPQEQPPQAPVARGRGRGPRRGRGRGGRGAAIVAEAQVPEVQPQQQPPQAPVARGRGQARGFGRGRGCGRGRGGRGRGRGARNDRAPTPVQVPQTA